MILGRAVDAFGNNERRRLWVPAFAGTTWMGYFHNLTNGPSSPSTGSVFGSFTAGIVFIALA
jgi:hypothetical protein